MRNLLLKEGPLWPTVHVALNLILPAEPVVEDVDHRNEVTQLLHELEDCHSEAERRELTYRLEQLVGKGQAKKFCHAHGKKARRDRQETRRHKRDWE